MFRLLAALIGRDENGGPLEEALAVNGPSVYQGRLQHEVALR